MSSHHPHREDEEMDLESEDDAILDPNEAAEVIEDDGDAPMDSDSDGEDDEGHGHQDMDVEIQLQNDSIAYFDGHKDSIFCIAQHPVHPNIVATGGGDDVGYVFDVSEKPEEQGQERSSLKSLFKLEGHTDSINAITFTNPKGQYIATAGLDGKLRTWQGEPQGKKWKFMAEASEVEEINWLVPCPSPEHPNVVALGANDGSVWVYQLDVQQKASPLTVIQAFYLHTEATTAGAWSPDGKFLATVSEDSSLYVWDVFGEAATQGMTSAGSAQTVVGLTATDERFRVEGGLFCVAVAPNGAFVAVGGPEGQIRVIGLPRLASPGVKASMGQAGQILAALQGGYDNVETISFSSPPLTLMAAGNVDGTITLFDTAHRFAIRRRITEAHMDEEEEVPQAVVKVEFVKKDGSSLLRSVGFDGVVKSWEARGGTAAAGKGLVGQWKGHRGGGEGGGIMGFVQGPDGKTIVTAGDDSVALVFDTSA